jgi:hypothetical protein
VTCRLRFLCAITMRGCRELKSNAQRANLSCFVEFQSRGKSLLNLDYRPNLSNPAHSRHDLMTEFLCGLVVRVLDYRSWGPGFDSRALQKKK